MRAGVSGPQLGNSAGWGQLRGLLALGLGLGSGAGRGGGGGTGGHVGDWGAGGLPGHSWGAVWRKRGAPVHPTRRCLQVRAQVCTFSPASEYVPALAIRLGSLLCKEVGGGCPSDSVGPRKSGVTQERIPEKEEEERS